MAGMIMRRRLLVLTLLAPVAALAQTPPTAPVTALDEGILAVMRAAHTTTLAQRVQMFTPIAQSAFDLPRILRESVGPRFASFAPSVQADLLDVFIQFTVASYVANFDDYSGERFELLPETRPVGSDVVVQTRLVPAKGDPVKLDYVVHRDNDDWKIIDVLLDGSISRVAVQRSDFRSLLSNGDAGPLIASLRGKVARLAAGQRD